MLGLVASLLLSTPLFAQQAFVAGTDYKLIEPAVITSNPDKVVVTEVFWYGCPHCFRFEPYIENWVANLPEGVVFEQLPSVLNPHWSEHARAYYTLQLMGELEKHGDNSIHRKLFYAIHIERKRLAKADTIAKFVGAQGVDEDKFRQVYSSFQVDALLRKNRQIEGKYGHNGVPAVIVNGKYLTSASAAGSNERLIQVIDYLVAIELSQ